MRAGKTVRESFSREYSWLLHWLDFWRTTHNEQSDGTYKCQLSLQESVYEQGMSDVSEGNDCLGDAGPLSLSISSFRGFPQSSSPLLSF